jgi:hypothetical protein
MKHISTAQLQTSPTSLSLNLQLGSNLNSPTNNPQVSDQQTSIVLLNKNAKGARLQDAIVAKCLALVNRSPSPQQQHPACNCRLPVTVDYTVMVSHCSRQKQTTDFKPHFPSCVVVARISVTAATPDSTLTHPVPLHVLVSAGQLTGHATWV